MLTKKSKEDLIEYYLEMLSEQAEETGQAGQAEQAEGNAAKKVLASLNSLADSDTGNPISINGKIEILDGMKKRAQQQHSTSGTSGNLLVTIDNLKHRIERDFQEQYQKYYGQQMATDSVAFL